MTDPREPKLARGQKTRDAIMIAAREVLAEVGRDRLTISMVVRRAGISVGSFYQYFRNKVEVLDAIEPNRDMPFAWVWEALAYVDKSLDNLERDEVVTLDGTSSSIELVGSPWDPEDVAQFIAEVRSILTTGKLDPSVSWRDLFDDEV